MTEVKKGRVWWRVERDGDRVRVEVGGQIDESADFDELRSALRGVVELDLGAITRINSTGVRKWVQLVSDLPAARELYYAQCSPAVVTQLNTIYNFRGRAKVRSLIAPYVCEACGAEESKLLDLAGVAAGAMPSLPRFPCPKCGAAMAFDDLPERYLSFLKDA